MRLLLSLLLCALPSFLAAAQNRHTQMNPNIKLVDTVVNKSADGTLDTIVQKLPTFMGLDGRIAFPQWCAGKIKYPRGAAMYNIKGTVACTFIVEPDSTLSEVKVKYGVHKLLDKEAVRVIQSCPKGAWTPATQNGEPVRFMYVVGLDFVLN